MARLFFATTLFIFTLFLFIVSIIYIVTLIRSPIDQDSILWILLDSLLLSISGGGAFVLGLIVINQAIRINKTKNEYEDELPHEPFISINKLRGFLNRLLDLKKTVTFIYVTVFLVLVVAGGIIWEIASNSDDGVELEKATNLSDARTNNNKSSKIIKIPITELENLSGDASINSIYNTFSGNLYNGSSDWNIRKIIVRITVKETDGKIRWIRDFDVSVNIPALSVGSFYINVNEVKLIGLYEWNILELWGNMATDS